MKNCIISYNAATTTGDQEKNQDVFLADYFISSPNMVEDQNYVGCCNARNSLHVFAVCDGIGMHEDSGRAAEIALKEIRKRCIDFNEEENDLSIDSLKEWVAESLVAAKDSMLSFCKDNKINGSSTIVILAIANGNYVMSNIGDSPAFIIENNEIKELSLRHNMATLKKMIGATPSEGEECILLHHLGEDLLTCEEKVGMIKENTVFFICSDGVSNVFDNKDLFDLLQDGMKSDFFVLNASKVPGSDNCTAIMICISNEG